MADGLDYFEVPPGREVKSIFYGTEGHPDDWEEFEAEIDPQTGLAHLPEKHYWVFKLPEIGNPYLYVRKKVGIFYKTVYSYRLSYNDFYGKDATLVTSKEALLAATIYVRATYIEDLEKTRLKREEYQKIYNLAGSYPPKSI